MGGISPPAIPTETPGLFITSAMFNTVVGNGLTFALNPPEARLYQAVAQSIPYNALTALTFDSSFEDTYAIHSTTSSNTTCTINQAGVYLIQGGCSFAANTTGYRLVGVIHNGTLKGKTMVAPDPSFETVIQTNVMLRLAVNDTIQLGAQQYSGGALSTLVTTPDVQPFLNLCLIHL